MPKVNPQILVWARETAGLTRRDAAAKLGLSGEDRLQALEAGQREPTRRQLSNMSERYRRPLVTFYLTKPPREAAKGQDFRRLPETATASSEPLVNALIRDVQARQQLVKAALEEEDAATRLPFVGSVSIEQGPDSVAASIRDTLDFRLEDYRRQRNITEAFSYLRRQVESRGVFVLLIGNLGTHHTDIGVRVFRGFALADEVAPFVIVNEKDSRAAWSFTLLHELTHVWLGETGISGYDSDADTERFCDAVAGKLLLRDTELQQLAPGPNESNEHLKQRIDDFSAQRKVSRKMVTYNLLRIGFITANSYRALVSIFDREREAQEQQIDEGEGGPNYYIVRRHRIGPALLSVTGRMLADGTLTTTKAAKVLGVKPTAVGRLLESKGAAA